MVDKLPIKTENYWAHHVYKVEKNGKPFIAAILRRKYGEGFEDVDDSGTAEIILGIEAKPKKRMIWDNNPDSETFQQRIEDPNDEGGEIIQVFTLPMTPKVVEEIEKMCGLSNYGETEYFWLYHGKTPIRANSLEELTEGGNIEILREYQNEVRKVKKND